MVLGCNYDSETDSQSKTDVTDPRAITGSIKIEGSDALYPLVVRWAEVFQKEYPNINISVERGIITDLKNEINLKSLDLVMLSRELAPEEEDSALWRVCVAKMGVVPVICTLNPFIDLLLENGLTHEQLIHLFTSSELITWGELVVNNSTEPVHVYIREDYSGATKTWKDFLWLTDEEFQGIQASGDDEMIAFIQEDPMGIGYCNLIYAFDPATGLPIEYIQVLPIDLNYNGRIDFKEKVYNDLKEYQRAICIGKYPKSLCRSLQLVAINKPNNPATKIFIEWILTEGQEVVAEAGYVRLSNRAMECALRCME